MITLRHPVHLAKQAASIDVLSGGRFPFGMALGDRPAEYPLFRLAHDFEQRGERFREAHAMFRVAGEARFPVAHFERYGDFSGNLDVISKPYATHIPTLVVGRSWQERN